jgi:hypothetical protein
LERDNSHVCSRCRSIQRAGNHPHARESGIA